jgi:hypothetical protein
MNDKFYGIMLDEEELCIIDASISGHTLEELFTFCFAVFNNEEQAEEFCKDN